MTEAVRIAVAGAGLIGKRHVEAIAAAKGAALACIVDPAEAARTYAEGLGAIWYPTLAAMFEAKAADGVILATPNQMHVENGIECVAAGVPALVEKPVAIDVAGAEKLVAAGEAAGLPLLVGHHRRHNQLVQRAQEVIRGGALGTIVAVHAMCWFYKPDDYFDVAWRRQPGAGPVFLNLIHDIDLLRCLCGEIETLQALESSAVRANPVEDTAAILLRFASGALGTISVTDTIVAPWSWEMTARENPAYPATGESCYQIGGTHGSLELPSLRLWRNRDRRSWWEPIDATVLPFGFEDPLVRQVRQFAAVIRGEEAPLAPAREGLETLRVIEAVKRSARSGEIVRLK
ncbi:MAG TPA: Gfo/Idh/MocA family oxidoreductase [Vicinamibacterales bacterium]|nr:Gfo/Idh/MocA family oxidoreductase [Vicinamibacterales bacterium]